MHAISRSGPAVAKLGAAYMQFELMLRAQREARTSAGVPWTKTVT